MKFLVGYQQRPSPEFVNEIINQKNKIGEVYFSFVTFSFYSLYASKF